MSIRLNKALRELNIGLQTAVEFLEKKSDLGEVKADVSFKLNDAQYKALVEAFKQDAAVLSAAKQLFPKNKEKKRETDSKRTETRSKSVLEGTSHQQYKPLGKIDLDNLGKKPVGVGSAAPEPVKKEEAKTAAVSREPEKVVAEKPVSAAPEKVAPKAEAPKVEPAKKAEPAKVVKAEEPVKKAEPAKPAQQAAPAPAKPAEAPKANVAAKATSQNNAQKEAPKQEAAPKKAEENAQPAQQEEKSGVFQLSSERKILNTPKVNVLGKIDLSTINQSTRPRKKSKEERRKEREAKGQNGANAGDRKKRQRINKERVDINAVGQQNNRNGNDGGNNNAGNNNNNNNHNNNWYNVYFIH